MGNAVAVRKDPITLKIGILGCARIAKGAIIDPVKQLSNVTLVAVASRSLNKAKEYARKHSIPKHYGSYESLLQDESLDAIYIPLPNGMHCEWTIKALQAGKHVLCEKPMASNAREAQMMLDESRKAGKVLMEAVHYRHHPIFQRVREIIDSGEIGRIQHISASMCFAAYFKYFSSEAKDDDVRFDYSLAGGTMMDMGIHPLTCIRFIANKEPTEVVSAQAVLMKPEIDCTMDAAFKFDDGMTAKLHCSFREPGWGIGDISFDVEGDKGKIHCYNFALPHFYHKLTITSSGTTRVEKAYGDGKSTYYLQLNEFANRVLGRSESVVDVSPESAVASMRIIDAIYEKAGLRKRGETL